MTSSEPLNKPKRGRGHNLDPIGVIQSKAKELKAIGSKLNDPVLIRQNVLEIDKILKDLADLQRDVGQLRRDLVNHEKDMRKANPSKKKGRALRPGQVIKDSNGNVFVINEDLLLEPVEKQISEGEIKENKNETVES